MLCEAFVEEARTWLDTPWHDKAEVKAAGVDCAGLLLAVYCGLGFAERPRVDYYAVDWFLHHDRERFLERIQEQCVPVTLPCVGDIALFHAGRATAHGAIVTEISPRTILHADRQVGRVIEEVLQEGHPWQQRLTGYWSLARWH